MLEKGIAFLKMEGDRVINFRPDAFLLEKRPKVVAVRDPDHVLVVDMAILVLFHRKLKTG